MAKDKKDLKFDTKGRAKTVRYATEARKAKINPDNIEYLTNSYINIVRLHSKDFLV